MSGRITPTDQMIREWQRGDPTQDTPKKTVPFGTSNVGNLHPQQLMLHHTQTTTPTTTFGQPPPLPLPAESATDDELLGAASTQAHVHSLRGFLRHAAAQGHEVLINHSVG